MAGICGLDGETEKIEHPKMLDFGVEAAEPLLRLLRRLRGVSLGRGWRRRVAGARAVRTTAMLAPDHSAAAVVTAHHLAAMLFMPGLELLPLIGSEHLADLEEHVGIGLLEVGPRLGDLVGLRQDLRLVRVVGLDHGA